MKFYNLNAIFQEKSELRLREKLMQEGNLHWDDVSSLSRGEVLLRLALLRCESNARRIKARLAKITRGGDR